MALDRSRESVFLVIRGKTEHLDSNACRLMDVLMGDGGSFLLISSILLVKKASLQAESQEMLGV